MDDSSIELSGIRLGVLRFCTALRFLTILPVSWRAFDDGENFTKSLPYFALVGLLIGGIGLFLASLLLLIFPTQVVAVISIVYLAGVSGCLHLDGLADSGDGLLSARSRESSLAIMKDSRVGAMGVIVVVFVLLAKYAALSSMTGLELCGALFFMPLGGRCAILVTMATLRYARPEGGLGSLFYADFSRFSAFCGAMVFVLLLLICYRWAAVLTLTLVAIGILFFNGLCRAKLGGATGDTLGAGCEIAEMIVAIAFTASFS
jgi:adenosylcobinamide-GDP ribazoletransferase